MTDLSRFNITVTNVWGGPIPQATIEVEEHGLPGSEHYRATVEAAGYIGDSTLIGFDHRAELTLLLDPAECECPTELGAARDLFAQELRSRFVAGNRLSSFVTMEPIHVRLDRAFYACDPALGREVAFSKAYDDAPGGMHHPPEGRTWEQIGSWKSTDPALNVQLTFWRGGTEPGDAGRMWVEVDVDRHRGVRHVWDALIRHPLTGQDDPRILAQLIVLYRGLPLPFDMIPPGLQGVRATAEELDDD